MSTEVTAQVQIVDLSNTTISNSQDVFCGYTSSKSYRVTKPNALNFSKLEWTVSSSSISLTTSLTDSSLITIGWINQINPITVSLSVTDTSSSSVADTISVIINPVPNVSLSLNSTTFQRCSAPVTLSGGVPSGGSYSISGYPNAINSLGQIDPSELPLGNHSVTYSYINVYGCSSAVNQNIDITGFVLTGSGVNLLVSEVTAAGSTPILSNVFNGITTYSICSGGANTTFSLTPLTGLSGFSSYSVNWGDGSTIQNGTISSTSPIARQYNVAGLYSVILTLTDTSGCSIVETFNLYFGTTQTLGLTTPGNTTVCFLPGQDSTSFDFEISNWASDPAGISYEFSANDGSIPKNAVSPLVLGGVSQYSFIEYDNTTQTASYRHYFYSSSCTYTTTLGGTSYNNTFSISATKTAPCPGSQSTAAVGPIVISESPSVQLNGPDSTCTETYVTILDNSNEGKMVVADLVGNNFSCDGSSLGYWTVFDDNSVLLSSTSGMYTLGTSSFLGNSGVSAAIPAFWTTGSTDLSIKFNFSGNYTIVKHIGLTAFGGNTLCSVDSDSISICVDTIPETIIAVNIPDTICIGTAINTSLFSDSINCNSPTQYRLSIFDSTYLTPVYQSVLTIDTNFSWTPTNSGKYIFEYTSENQCGSNILLDTLYAIDIPDVFFPPNDTIYCRDSLIISFGQPPFSVIQSNNINPIDNIVYTISPLTGWTSLGPNVFGNDSIVLFTPQAYIIQAIATNQCGSKTVVTSITLDSIPNPTFNLVSPNGCSPFSPSINQFFTHPDKTHTWIVYDSNNNTIQTTSGLTPTFTALTNTSNTNDSTYSIKHIVETGSGCADSLTLTVTVLPNPEADFTVSNADCAPWTPAFTNNAVGNNLTYLWSIDNIGTFTSLATLGDTTNLTPSLSFLGLQYPNADQQYFVTLIATSDSGCTDSFADTLTLYARPLADFTLPIDSTCGPYSLTPTDASGSNSNISSWNWTLTDSAGVLITTSTLSNPTFSLPQSFNGVATYSLQLIVTDDRSCSDTTTQNLYINPTPTAGFTLSDSTCTGVNLNSLLANNSNSNLSYSWNLDSAGISILTSNDPVPSFVLNNNDTTTFFYTLSLTVTNGYGCDSTVFDSIAVHPNAIAQLNTIGPIVDCAPLLIDNSLFTANHYSGNGIYNWQVIDSDGSVLNTTTGRSTLNYNLLNSGDTVTVILSVSSVFGCQASLDSIVVYTLPNPDPYFKLAQDTGCSAFTVILDSLGQSSGSHFWIIRDTTLNQIGSTLTGVNPIFPALSATSSTGLTSYIVEHLVYAIDTSSCDSSFVDIIYVQPKATPTIDSIAYYCAQDTVSLSGASTNNNNVGQWIWDISGDTLLGQTVSYFNSIPGVYPVSLTTITLAGCDTTVFDTLVVHSYPEAQIWINDCGLDTVCVNQSFFFQDTSSSYQYGGNLVAFNWDFNDDGSTDYTTSVGSHTFSTTGIKQLRLTVESEFGCIDDTLIQVYVNAPPYSTFGITDSVLCGPAQFSVLESDTGIVDSSYYELHAFDNSNNKVIIQSWQALPVNLPVLAPNYLSDTTYFLTKSLFNCCGSLSITDSIIIRTPPVADFVVIPDSGCTPLNTIIQLDGLIKGQADSAYIDFGDGADLSLIPTLISQGSTFIYQWGQPQHTFTYGGNSDTTYIVSLTVYNDCGDSTYTQPVYLQPNTVQATFNADKSSGCSPLTVNFTNYSYNASSLVWCFDWNTQNSSCNGSSSTLTNPTWVFTQSGTYTVALLVDNGCGYDTAYQQIIVYPSPNAVISSPNNVCANDTLSFTSNSNTSAGWIAGYLWDFGDGDTSILTNPNHLYDSSGTYIVTLTVTSSNGCLDSSSQSVILQPTPLAGFTANDVCLNDTTLFSNLSTIPSGQIIGTSWDFGDGNSSNLFNPKHVYSAPGTYTVTLTHTSDFGCVDSTQEIVLVYDLPILSFNATMTSGDSCSLPQTYLFTNNSSNAIQYLWDFDYLSNPGVNLSSLTSPSHTFNLSGEYVIGLFAENSFGCFDSLFKTILVRDGVVTYNSINPLDGCEPLTVSFIDSSIYTAALDTIESIQWYFGDGSNTVITTPPYSVSHTYNSYGVYTAYSIVTMTSGCSDSSSSTILNVYPTPSAGFTINRVNINTRSFVNSSQFIDSSITYYWTFSDGQTSNEQSPTVSFEPSTTAGIDSITACLYVSNSYGCSDSICSSIWVWPTNLTVPNAFAPDLDYVGDDALFLPKGHSLDQYELWIYDKWGNNVFYTNEIDPIIKSPSEGWNGNDIKTGEPVPMGVYAWRIRALFDDGTRWTGQKSVYDITKAYGTLTLIR